MNIADTPIVPILIGVLVGVLFAILGMRSP